MALFGVNPGEYLDYVIVGLGNPGDCYEYTRHNIGFKFIDYLQAQTDTNRGCKRKLHYSLVDKCVLNNNVVYMVKPQTYMNNSGMAVQDILRYYKLKHAKLIVLHDDITLPVGCFKLKFGGSAGGHNGIKSIIEHIGTNEFIHVKIGVGKKPEGWELSSHVLSKFPNDEYELIKKRFYDMYGAIKDIMNYGIERAMSINNPVGKTLDED